MPATLAELARLTSSRLSGDGSCLIETVADICSANEGAIAFVADPKYKKHLQTTQASALIVTAELAAHCDRPMLIADNPRLVYARVANLLFPPETYPPGVSAQACVDATAQVAASASVAAGAVIAAEAIIGEGACIGSGAVIGHHVEIGDYSVVHANATVAHHCKVGRRCILHSGSVIGADGFGFVRDENGCNIKIPQTGRVVLGDEVEVGACTSIDRGALDDTVIGNGVKLDNQIQVAHSVQIGDNTIISAATAIAGSTRIGKNCLIGGLSGIREHIEIADNVTITARSLITHSIKRAGSSWSSSTPMDETASWRRNSARFRQLDKMARRIADLEKQVKTLKHPSD